MKVGILDPGLQTQHGEFSTNLGDLIIQDAVNREIRRMFPGADLQRFSTHSPLQDSQLDDLASIDRIFVGGTNLLTSKFRPWNRWNSEAQCWSNQWSINVRDAWKIKRAVLVGAGWVDYQQPADVPSRLMYWCALDRHRIHSVRDSYSVRMLRSAGVRNALNTGCVTLWDLDPEILSDVPCHTASTVLVMLTDYRQDPVSDRALLQLLSTKYDEVLAWPQGDGDQAYLAQLGYTGTVLDRSLGALDTAVLSHPSLDYIGTRLHGGIRCLQHSRRSLILAVDNRATEIAKDTSLPVLQRGDLDGVARWIQGSLPLELEVPFKAISEWRDQFGD